MPPDGMGGIRPVRELSRAAIQLVDGLRRNKRLFCRGMSHPLICAGVVAGTAKASPNFGNAFAYTRVPAAPAGRGIQFIALRSAAGSGAAASMSHCVVTISTASEAAMQPPSTMGMFHEICSLVTP